MNNTGKEAENKQDDVSSQEYWQDFWAELIEKTSFEAIAIFDNQHRCIHVNKQFLRIFKYKYQETLGLRPEDFLRPELQGIELVGHPYDACATTKTNNHFYVITQQNNLVYKKNNLLVISYTCIGEEKRDKDPSFEKAYAELNTIFENSMVGIMILRGDRIMKRVNQRILDIFGYDDATELVGNSVHMLHKSQKHFEEFGHDYYYPLEYKDINQVEYQCRRKDGSSVWISASGKALDSSNSPDLAKGVVWMMDDISERKSAEKQLVEMATIDSLTGVNNRRNFMQLGEREVAIHKRYSRALSILMLDIDHFKVVNDTWGHSVGDTALIYFAQSCEKSLRSTDILGRLGGEEFAILLPDTAEEEAKFVAERIRKALESSTPVEEPFVPAMTVSIGIDTIFGCSCNADLELALQHADNALYEAKRNGRNRVHIYKPNPTPENK